MRRSGILVLSLLHLVMLVASQAPPPGLAPPTGTTGRIDTHTHYVPPFYKAYLDARNITAGGLPIPEWNVSAHLAMQDMFGIATSVVSVSTPGAKLSVDAPIEEGRSLARQLNEYGYNLTQEYPKRFLFFASLTLPDLEGAVAEAIYALDTLGAAGVIIEASFHGELMGTPRYAPLYKVLDDRKAVVFIHPSNSPCPTDPVETANSTDLPAFVIDFLLDTSRAALNLVYRNVTTDYPNIKFLLAHSGGFLPFAATRGAGGLALLSDNPSGIPEYLAKISQSFHVDVAISANEASLLCTTAIFNTTQLTFGSDYPFVTIPGVQQNTQGLDSFSLSNSARRKVNSKNARGLFKKFLK